MIKTYRRKPRRYFKKAIVPRPLKAYVKNALDKNVEDKVQQSQLDDTFNSIGNAWIDLVLCNPAQGTAENQRVGRMIKLRSLEIKGVIAQGSAESAVDDAYNVVRVVIGLYNQVSATPLVGIAGINDPISKTHFTRGRLIRKYLDQYIPLQVTSTEKGEGDGYTPGLRLFKYYKRFKTPITLKFGDDTTTYIDKYLIMSCISDSAAIVNPGFVAGYEMVHYEDA